MKFKIKLSDKICLKAEKALIMAIFNYTTTYGREEEKETIAWVDTNYPVIYYTKPHEVVAVDTYGWKPEDFQKEFKTKELLERLGARKKEYKNLIYHYRSTGFLCFEENSEIVELPVSAEAIKKTLGGK